MAESVDLLSSGMGCGGRTFNDGIVVCVLAVVNDGIKESEEC